MIKFVRHAAAFIVSGGSLHASYTKACCVCSTNKNKTKSRKLRERHTQIVGVADDGEREEEKGKQKCRNCAETKGFFVIHGTWIASCRKL